MEGLHFVLINFTTVKIEAIIVNSRPLTYVYFDSEGVSYALSPSHLLYGHCLIASHNSAHYEIVSTHNHLVLRHKQQEHLFN